MKPIYTTLFHLLLLVLLPIAALAQAPGPELSADEPIAYTDDNGILIATGNAVYQDAGTRVEADLIRYDRTANRVEASGNVRAMRGGVRLLTQHLVYSATDRTFSAGPFRAGYPPLFIEGESFSGTLESIDFSRVSVYYREPMPESPRLQVRNGRWVAGESLSGKGVSLRALGPLAIPLPNLRYAFGTTSLTASASGGYTTNLGLYAQSQVLYPFSDSFSAGANFDVFLRRGVLFGPAAAWQTEDGLVQATLDTGWIHDGDETKRGFDLLGRPIAADRGFAGATLQSRSEDGSLQFQARSLYVKDSETLRDFRPDTYLDDYHPDTFADFTWQSGSFLLNAFARTQINDSYGMIERLPELRAEWLPTQIGTTGLFLQAQASAVRYRRAEIIPSIVSVLFPDNALGLPNLLGQPGTQISPADLVQLPTWTRLDGSFTLTRPVHLGHGYYLVLRAGGRWTYYDQQEDSALSGDSVDRHAGELGFDLSRTLARTYRINLPTWDIERLKHISRPLLSVRWHPGADEDASRIPAYEPIVYQARRPVLDLADISHTDTLTDWSVARLGWENLFLTAREGESFREFLALNLYQDILFSAEGETEDLDALYIEAEFAPFNWLGLQLRQKIDTGDGHSESTFLQATIRSADLWSVSLRAEYLIDAIEQYRIQARYRLSENVGLLAEGHYDARTSTWTRQQFGFSRRFGGVWMIETYLAFNDANVRDEDFSVGLRVRFLSY